MLFDRSHCRGRAELNRHSGLPYKVEQNITFMCMKKSGTVKSFCIETLSCLCTGQKRPYYFAYIFESQAFFRKYFKEKC